MEYNTNLNSYKTSNNKPLQNESNKKDKLYNSSHILDCAYKNCRILALQSEGRGGSKNSLKLSLDTLIGTNSYVLVSTPDPYVANVFTTQFNNEDFNDYDVIIVGWSGNISNLTPDATEVSNALAARKTELENWIRQGGSIIVLPDYLTNKPYSFLPLPVTRIVKHAEDVIITVPLHTIMEGLTDSMLSNWSNSYHVVFDTFNSNYLKIAQNNLGEALTLVTPLDCGKIILTAQDADWHISSTINPNAERLLCNMIKYACTKNCCINPNPRTCCQVMIDHKTQLVPPALIDRNHYVDAIRSVDAVIEKVLPEKVIICGVIHKKITYTPVDSFWKISEKTIDIYDDISFQCFIDRDDATLGVNFKVVGVEILGTVFEKAQNFQKHPSNSNITIAWKFVEKDVVKVCIERDEPRPHICS